MLLLALSCARSRSHSDGGAADIEVRAGSTGMVTVPRDSGDGAAGGSSTRNCSLAGWTTVAALSDDCHGVCEPDVLALRLPKLTWTEKPEWCSGCFTLDTPWASTDAQRQSAVDGTLRALGPGPDFIKLGMFPDATSALIGVYDSQSQPVAGFFVDGTIRLRPSLVASILARGQGRRASDAETGSQFFSQAAIERAPHLFDPSDRAFEWTAELVGMRAINDMWFSDQRQVIDLSGQLWVADLSSQSATQVSAVPGAPPWFRSSETQS